MDSTRANAFGFGEIIYLRGRPVERVIGMLLARGACGGSCDWCMSGGAGLLPPVGVLGIGVVVGGARSLPPVVGVVTIVYGEGLGRYLLGCGLACFVSFDFARGAFRLLCLRCLEREVLAEDVAVVELGWAEMVELSPVCGGKFRGGVCELADANGVSDVDLARW